MVIEQTVEITENHWLRLELPPGIPIGTTAKVAITVPALTGHTAPAQHTIAEEAVEKCWGIAKNSGLSSDRFLEMKRAELQREQAIDARLWNTKTT